MRMWLCDYKDCQGKLFPIHAFEQVNGVGWVHKVVPRHTKGGRLVGTSSSVPNLPMRFPGTKVAHGGHQHPSARNLKR